jgi:hypothetical protein
LAPNRFKDFDAAWAEKTSPALSVKVLGKNYTLPAALPVKVVLILARLKDADPNAPVPPETVIQLLEPFFGEGTLDKWAKAGMDTDQMGDVFKWAMSVYQGLDPDAATDEADAEDDDPNS